MLPRKPAVDFPDVALEALGNAERRRLIRALAETAKSVGELASIVPISRPAVSRHLRLLEDAGLVTHRAEGTRNIYQLDSHGLQATADWLSSFWDEAEMRLKLVAENTRPKANPDG